MRPRGFTVIEVLVVLSVLSAIAALSLFASFDMLSGATAREERDMILALLERVRSHALDGIYDASHGLCIESGEYRIMSGTAVEERAIVQAEVTGIPACGAGSISFSRLFATTTPVSISVSTASETYAIDVSEEGTITW